MLVAHFVVCPVQTRQLVEVCIILATAGVVSSRLRLLFQTDFLKQMYKLTYLL